MDNNGLMTAPVSARIGDLIAGLRAGQVTAQEAADRLEVLAIRRPIQALAQEAVDAMGDIFYDYDDASKVYGTETATCPECGENIPNLSESCSRCGAEFAEPVSRNQQVFAYAVSCVAAAIQEALAGGGGVR